MMRNRSLMWLIVSLVVGISLIISACAPAAPAPEVPEEEALRLTIAGGSVGGSGHLAANAAGGIAKKYLDLDATVITWPMTAMERALHEGAADIVTAKVNQIYDAVTCTGIYADYPEPMVDIRPLYFIQPASLQILVLKDSPYETFRDIIGKRVCPAFPATSQMAYLGVGLPAIGLSFEDDFDVVFSGSHKTSAASLIAGKVEACFNTGGPPQPAFEEANLVHPIRLIGFTEEDIDAITAKFPFYVPLPIAADYYSMEEPVLTYGAPTLAAATTRLPDDIAYGFTKHYIENPEFVRFYHSGQADYIVSGLDRELAESIVMSLPYHPGAYRYYKEVGWNIPAEMIPPEAK